MGWRNTPPIRNPRKPNKDLTTSKRQSMMGNMKEGNEFVISDVDVIATVRYPPRIVETAFGERYEISQTEVRVSLNSNWSNATTRGYKLTKAGRYSKSAPRSMPFWGSEETLDLEEAAIAFVREWVAGRFQKDQKEEE